MTWQTFKTFSMIEKRVPIMPNNPFKSEITPRGGQFTHLTRFKPTYPTGKESYSYQTPYTLGLKKTKTPIEKAQDKPTSLRLAINAKCFDCVGCGFDPKPHNEIRNCQITDCPLWNLRPYQNKKSADHRGKSTADFNTKHGGLKND